MGNEVQVDDGVLQPCNRCGYLIVCNKGVQCSECGHLYDADDEAVARRRQESLAGADVRVRKTMVRWVLIWMVYLVGGLGAMWGIESRMPWEIGIVLVTVLSALIWGSIGLGWMVSRLAPVFQRRLLWLGWLEALPLMHMSWLSIAGFTVIGSVIAAGVGLFAEPDSSGEGISGMNLVLVGYVGFAFLVWGLGSMVMLFAWPVKMSQYLAEREVVGFQPGIGGMWLAGVFVYLMACIVGFLGGYLGAGFIMSLGG